ncbi:MAG: aminopeptidase, partial [Chitinophagaceae bacterium]
MKKLLLFEWLPFKKRWSFYVLAIVFFALGCMIATGANFPFADVYKNGSYINAFVIALFSLMSILSVTILAAQVLLKEQDANFQQVLYATPVSKNKLLLSRFILIAGFASMLFVLFVTGLAVGHALLPAEDRTQFNSWYYLQPFLVFGLPNILFCSAIICSVGWLSQNKLMIYLSGLMIYVSYIIISIFSNSPLIAGVSPASDEAMSIAAKADPFGLAALFEQTKHWSPAERNTKLLSFSGNLMLNRLVWLTSSLLIAGLAIKRFQFKVGHKKTKPTKAFVHSTAVTTVFKSVQPNHGSAQHSLQTIASFIKLDFKSNVKGIPFSLLCVAFIFLLGMEIFGTIEAGIRLPQRYATTGLMVNTTLKTIPFICLLAILFYSSELLWRSKAANIAQLENSTGMSSSMMLLSKIISLSIIPFVLIVLSIVTGIAFQKIYQYPVVDLELYLTLFYTIGLPLLCSLVILISLQSFFKNKYVGIAVAVVFVLLTNTSIGGMFGLKNTLFKIGNSYPKLYSEMNGFDQYLQPFG